MKKLISAAATATLLAVTALPAMAASPTVTIQWNVTATASLNLYENYNNAGATSTTLPVGSASPTYGNLLTGNNGGGGTCGGGTVSVTESTTAGILNIGNVQPDPLQATICMISNAVEAQIVTNDSKGVTVAESIAAPTNNTTAVCADAVVNSTPAAWQSSGVAGSTMTTASKAYDTAVTTSTALTGSTCAGLKYGATSLSGVGTTSGSATAYSGTFLKTSDDSEGSATMYAGQDLAVVFPANAASTPSGDSSVITYTITTN